MYGLFNQFFMKAANTEFLQDIIPGEKPPDHKPSFVLALPNFMAYVLFLSHTDFCPLSLPHFRAIPQHFVLLVLLLLVYFCEVRHQTLHVRMCSTTELQPQSSPAASQRET